ncbi:MAG TPA: hypothetical protein VFU51_13110 [Gaiellaceae bacterium]|nr:hypothetical protein [Gaiellaceae bacterium]
MRVQACFRNQLLVAVCCNDNLPALHIRWSGPPVTYDLDDRGDRVRVYEQVLREGTEDDVRFYVEEDHLLELWDELVLPPAVREAWRPWIEDRGRSR